MVQPNLYIDASTLGSDVLEEMRDAFLGMSGGLMLMSTFPRVPVNGNGLSWSMGIASLSVAL